MGLGNLMGALVSTAGSGNLQQAFSQPAGDTGQGGIGVGAQSVGPQLMASGALGSLGNLLGGGPQITPEQATQVRPEDMQQAAEHAQKHNPSIVDEASSFCTQHPTLYKA